MRGLGAQASGQAFENLIEYANSAYLRNGEAYVNKREVAVSITSNRVGKITGHLKEASLTDYEGILKGGRSIQFEAKTTEILTRFDLSKIEEHQVDFLEASAKMGAMSFLLVNFSELCSTFVVPSWYVVESYREWRRMKGTKKARASLPIDEIRHYGMLVKSSPNCPLDYIRVASDLGL